VLIGSQAVLRLSIASEFEEVVFSARAAFSKRSWPYVLATAIPWLLCAGQRSITRLSVLGRHRRSLSSYYRFLSDGKWRLEVLFRSLFELVVKTFRLDEITLVVDDTLCPKWGRSIYGTASYFDHAARPRAGFIWGHNWIVLAVVVPVGSAGWVSLPFWIGLYRPQSSCAASAFRTRHQITAEALAAVRNWFSGPILLLADGAYANRSLVLPALDLAIHVVSRLRSDARLYAPTPVRRRRGQPGRPPKHGPPLRKLPQIAKRSRGWRKLRVEIYGQRVHLHVHELVAWWPPLRRVIKVVITRDPKNDRRIAYLWTTDPDMSAREVIERFAQRWTIEQMFSVAKRQLGFDSAEVRKQRAVVRHATLCMALVTWVEVWTYRFRAKARERSFAHKIAALRAETVKQTVFSSGPRCEGSRRIANDLAKVFTIATKAA
jgi:hypothetical protein